MTLHFLLKDIRIRRYIKDNIILKEPEIITIPDRFFDHDKEAQITLKGQGLYEKQ